VCSVVLGIMRHCSHLKNNLIKELPDQIFDKNVKLGWLCVNSHRLASHVRGGAPAKVHVAPAVRGSVRGSVELGAHACAGPAVCV